MRQQKSRNRFRNFSGFSCAQLLTNPSLFAIIPIAVWPRGRGGIGIRARLRGVSSNGYGFKSRRPHYSRESLRVRVPFFVSLALAALFSPPFTMYRCLGEEKGFGRVKSLQLCRIQEKRGPAPVSFRSKATQLFCLRSLCPAKRTAGLQGICEFIGWRTAFG